MEDASWLIGEGIFTDEVEGSALRSLKAPGTAYDDDILGKDPQPAHFDDYVYTDEDSGGVHINSGIPNRAFYLVAEALGGNAWERAGQIWYDTITGPILTARADFSAFAAATVAAATARFGAMLTRGDCSARRLGRRWHWHNRRPHVGKGRLSTMPPELTITVVRSGGFAGLTRRWSRVVGGR